MDNEDDEARRKFQKRFGGGCGEAPSMIIGNPPWSKVIAPRVAEKCLNLTKNIILIMPTNIYEKNINKEHDKRRHTLGPYLKNLEVINDSNEQFGIGEDRNPAIWTFSKEGGFDWESIVDKLSDLQLKIQDQILKEDLMTIGRSSKIFTGDYFMMISRRHGHFKAGMEDGREWDYYDLFSRNQRVNDPGAKTGAKLFFKTWQEAENFRQSVFTVFYKYMISIYKKTSMSSLSSYPIMKDYTKPWTNARFYKYFNISQDEQEIIEKTMEKFK
jgi:hypothetical protein